MAREMAIKLGIRHEAGEQHLIVDAIGRVVAKLVVPQTMGLSRRPFVPRETDHVRTFAGLSDELEVGENDLFEVT
jgi:hypothetical protein